MRRRGLRSLRPPLLEKASYVRDTSTSTATVNKSSDRARVRQAEFLRSGGGQYMRRPLSAGRERRSRLAHDDREWLSSIGQPQDGKKRPRSACELPRDEITRGSGSCRSRLELALEHADLLGIRYVAGEWLEKYRMQENTFKHLYDMVADLKVEHDLAVQFARSGSPGKRLPPGWQSMQKASTTEDEEVWCDGQPYHRDTHEMVPHSIETTAEFAEGADEMELQQSDSVVFGGEPEEQPPKADTASVTSRMPEHYNRLLPRVMRQRRIAGSGRKARMPSGASKGRPELAVAGPVAKHVSADVVCAAPGPWGHPALSRPQSASSSAARRSEQRLRESALCLIQVPSVKEIAQCQSNGSHTGEQGVLWLDSETSTARTAPEPQRTPGRRGSEVGLQVEAAISDLHEPPPINLEEHILNVNISQGEYFEGGSEAAAPLRSASGSLGSASAHSISITDLDYQAADTERRMAWDGPRSSADYDMVNDLAWQDLYSQIKTPRSSNRQSLRPSIINDIGRSLRPSLDNDGSRSPRKTSTRAELMRLSVGRSGVNSSRPGSRAASLIAPSPAQPGRLSVAGSGRNSSRAGSRTASLVGGEWASP